MGPGFSGQKVLSKQQERFSFLLLPARASGSDELMGKGASPLCAEEIDGGPMCSVRIGGLHFRLLPTFWPLDVPLVS